MEGVVLLLTFSFAMFVGCLLAGSVPLAFSFSERKLRFVTVLGAGLLVGTALAVIIPEGVQSIYRAQTDRHNEQYHSKPPSNQITVPSKPGAKPPVSSNQEASIPVAVDKPKTPLNQINNTFKLLDTGGKARRRQKDDVNRQEAKVPRSLGGVVAIRNSDPGTGDIQRAEKQNGLNIKRQDVISDARGVKKIKIDKPDSVADTAAAKADSVSNFDSNNARQKRSIIESDSPAAPAPADVASPSSGAHHHHHSHVHGGTDKPGLLHIEVDAVIGWALVLGFIFMLIVDQISSSRHRSGFDRSRQQPRYNITATVGLVVHAAADGIALGAASTTSHIDIQFIVFIAIMLHKAPAAFGLVVFLMHEGLEKSRIRKHLLIFALAAPIAALVTYFGINQSGSESLSSINTTGVLMLFSAGTFLYVATVHVLPEIVSGVSGHSHSGSSSRAMMSSNIAVERTGFSLPELVALVIGALLPSVVSMGHSH